MLYIKLGGGEGKGYLNKLIATKGSEERKFFKDWTFERAKYFMQKMWHWATLWQEYIAKIAVPVMHFK